MSRLEGNSVGIAPFIRAMLLDHDLSGYELLESQLESLFISLEKAGSINTGNLLLKNNQFHIIFIEAHPYFNESSLEKIRDHQPDAVIILVVNENDTSYIQRGARADIDGFLLRPFNRSDIHRLLRKVINSMLSARRFEEYRQEIDRQLAESSRGEMKATIKSDSLTGLYNRLCLIEDLRKPGENAVILINLDNFSQINLGYGFTFGDEILRAVGNYLRSILPENGKAYRLHGDEFAIMLIEPSEMQEQKLADVIHAELPVLNLRVLEIGVKIGCSIGYVRGESEDIYRHASVAILEARSRGPGRIQKYHQHHNFERKQKENIVWINRLKSAFEEGRIQPWYQPIYDCTRKDIHKYECLIRMMSRSGDVISPANFLQPAEMAGLLPLITGAVVESAFPLLVDHPIELSINISDQDFRGLFLVEYLCRKVEELQVEPRRVTLEILEEANIGSPEERAAQIRELKKFGFKIALDDFGVSSSNFSRISEYEPDFIKIDGRFIRGIAENTENQKIVSLIHQVASGIGSAIVAEFVSNKEDFDYLFHHGIEFLQGNHIGAAGPFHLQKTVAV